MDALDVKILRTLGVKPFVARERPSTGLKPAAVAEALGKSPQVVKDRMARMEADGVIAGYRLFPNLKHCGMSLGSFHFLADMLPQKEKLSSIAAVDGLVGVLWFYGGDLCVDVSYATPTERARRLALVAGLLGAEQGPFPLYARAFPDATRPLTRLDWRIIRALQADARRPLHEVAEEVGVTTKTVRTRLGAMRREGAIEEHVELNYARMAGVIPFNLGAWLAPGGPDPSRELVERFDDRCLIRFPPSAEPGPPTFMLQLFAYTPAEVQALVAEALTFPGVERAGPLMPTGGYVNEQWVTELVDRLAGAEPRPLPDPGLVAPKKEILS